jgi:hypothetical protein
MVLANLVAGYEEAAGNALASSTVQAQSTATPDSDGTQDGVHGTSIEMGPCDISSVKSEAQQVDDLGLSTALDHQILVFPTLQSQTKEGRTTGTRDADTDRRIRETLRQLNQAGAFRPLRRPPDDWEHRLDELRADMPNFKSIIDIVVGPHLMFLSKDIRHRMPPVLLVGPPGIGKTLFASKLAKVMAVPHLFFVLPAESNGSGLAGSSTFWSNASPGRLFDLLAWDGQVGAIANPLVVLDEADKVQVGRYDPLASLYSLLERDTAAAFEDQSLPGLTIDASHVRFVLTANTVDSIPEALLSRVIIFNIESPTASELRRIAHQLIRETISGLGISMQADLPASVLEAAETMCPRQLRTHLEAAIAVTYSAGKQSLDETSWRQTMTEVLPTKRHRMGFL